MRIAAALALMPALVLPIALAQQNTPKQAAPPPILFSDLGGKALRPRLAADNETSKRYGAMSPDAFKRLFTQVDKPSLKACKIWIRAAAAITPESLAQLDAELYEDVPLRLRKCVQDHAGLTALELRRAVQAIYRFDQEEIGLFLESTSAKLKDITALQNEVHSAKAALSDVVGKYNSLVHDYNQLNDANGELFRTAQTLKLSVQQAQLDCTSATSQAYLNGITAAQQLDHYTPPAQPTVCRTELVGWTLVTKCN